MQQPIAILYRLSSFISHKLGIKAAFFKPTPSDPLTTSEPQAVAPTAASAQAATERNDAGQPTTAVPSIFDDGVTDLIQDTSKPLPLTSFERLTPENSMHAAADSRNTESSAQSTSIDHLANFTVKFKTIAEEIEPVLLDSPLANTEKSGDFSMDYDHLPIMSYSEEQLDASKRKLIELMRSCVGVYGLLIHTVDGHDLLNVLTRDLPSTKISTMTSSFLALGESIASESLQKLCQFAMLENSNGRVISLRINEILMLTCISTKESNPGMLLSTGKIAADAIAKILANPT